MANTNYIPIWTNVNGGNGRRTFDPSTWGAVECVGYDDNIKDRRVEFYYAPNSPIQRPQLIIIGGDYGGPNKPDPNYEQHDDVDGWQNRTGKERDLFEKAYNAAKAAGLIPNGV